MLVLSEIIGRVIYPYYWLADSNKVMALITSVCSFMYFKDIKLSYSPVINTVSACMFGVLLIHANSNTMREWLWKDMLDNVYYYSTQYFALHAFLSVLGVFIICTIIEFVRIKTIEPLILKSVDKILQKYNWV